MRAVDRFIAILEAVADELDPTSATVVARRIDLPSRPPSRLMAELEETGLLERADGRGRYVVGPRLRSLARAALHDPMLGRAGAVRARRPPRPERRDGLAARSARGARASASRTPRATTRSAVSCRSARTVPLHVGATGAMLLAHLPPGELDAYLTTAGLDDGEREALEARLAAARRDGWSCTVDVVEPGLLRRRRVDLRPQRRHRLHEHLGPDHPPHHRRHARLAPHVVAAAAEISRRAASISD